MGFPPLLNATSSRHPSCIGRTRGGSTFGAAAQTGIKGGLNPSHLLRKNSSHLHLHQRPHRTFLKTRMSFSFFKTSPPNLPGPSSSPIQQNTTRDKITIVNWNANGIFAKNNHRVQLLTDFLQEYSVDIAPITETHATTKNKLYVPNFSVYRCDRPNSCFGGVPTLVQNSIRHKAISHPTPTLESCGVEIIFNNKLLNIITCYSPSDKKNLSEIPLLFKEGIPTVLAGDFNAKHES